MKLIAAILACVLAAIVLSALPSAPAQMPSGRDVVAPSAFASLEPVGRGSSFQLAVVLKIRDGFHINARQPSADYLIPTDLRAEVPTGFKIGEISYPKGELRRFSFSKTPLNVYEDKIIIRMVLSALPEAPLGSQHIPLKIRYQACSTEACLPPVTLPVNATINVAANSAGSHPAHPELFPPQH
jgi:thiol:disulfide interchange protein DsbD